MTFTTDPDWNPRHDASFAASWLSALVSAAGMTTDPFPHIDLSVLTPRQREVVEMRYDSCLSFRAIAMLLDLDVKTVWEHHEAAIRRLGTCIPQHFTHKVDA